MFQILYLKIIQNISVFLKKIKEFNNLIWFYINLECVTHTSRFIFLDLFHLEPFFY